MNSQSIKQYLPIIKQAVKVNTILILYFIMPNFSSFAIATFLAIAIFTPQTLKQSYSSWSINQMLNEYLQFQTVRKLVTVVFIGLAVQITNLVPSWFIIFVAAELIAFYDLLVGLGAAELIASFANNTESAITKFFNLIPKYQEQK